MKQVGLWIDHRRAVIVTLEGKGDKGTVQEVLSGMEKHIRYEGGSDVQEGPAEDQVDKRYTGHLSKYYEDVADHLKDAGAILILGPGEAKTELEKVLAHHGLGKVVAGVQAADKLTDNQIAVLVRQHYQK